MAKHPPSRSRSGQRRPTPSSSSSTGPLIAGGIVALLIVLGGGAWLFSRSATPRSLPEPTAETADIPGAPATAPLAPTGPSSAPLQPQVVVNPVASSNPAAGWGLTDHLINLNGARSNREWSGDIVGDTVSYLRRPILAQAPDDWPITVDPPLLPLTFPAGKKKTVRWLIPEDITSVRDGSVIFPVSASPVVALGRNEAQNGGRIIMNLALNEELGRVMGLHDWADLDALYAVSPDGELFAGATFTTGGNATVYLYDVATGETKHEIGVPGFRRTEWLAAPNSQQVVLGSSLENHIAVIDAQTGKVLYQRPTQVADLNRGLAFSPGGKYVVEGKELGEDGLLLEWWELATGKTLTTLVVPFDAWRSWATTFNGLRFSPDGSELAALFASGPAGLLVIWNVATGTPKEQFVFESTVLQIAGKFFGTTGNTPLDFFPDQSRMLLHEMLVLDRGTGGFQGALPESSRTVRHSRRVLSDSVVTVVDFGRRDAGLLALELPQKFQPLDQVARKVELPPISKNEAKTFVKLDPPNAPETQAAKLIQPSPGTWKVPVEVWPELAQDIPSLSLKGSGQQMRAMAMRLGKQPTAVTLQSRLTCPLSVASEDSNLDEARKARERLLKLVGESAKNQRSWLSVYDLEHSKLSSEMVLDFPAELLDLSPNGQQIACLTWDATDTTQPPRERLVAVDLPTGKVIRDVLLTTGTTAGPMIASAAFAGSDVLLTMNSTGELTARDWPSLSPLYRVERVSQTTVSAQGGAFGYFDGSNWWFLASRSGEVLGQIANLGTITATGWHPSGEMMALLQETTAGPRLSLWDLKSGQRKDEYLVPSATGPIAWCEEDLLLLDNKFLFDLAKKAVVWTVPPDLWTHHLPQTQGGRHWWVNAWGMEAVLESLTLPGPQLTEILKTASTSSPFAVQPGDAIKLEWNANFKNTPPFDSTVVKQRLEKLLIDRGFRLDPSSKTILRFAFFESESNHTQSFSEKDLKTGQTVTKSRSAKLPSTSYFGEIRVNNQEVWSQRRAYVAPLPPDWETKAAVNPRSTERMTVPDPVAALKADFENISQWLPTTVLSPEAMEGAGKTSWRDLGSQSAAAN